MEIALAKPFILNLFLLLPFFVFFLVRKVDLKNYRSHFLALGIFGLAFAYFEAVAVVYLRTEQFNIWSPDQLADFLFLPGNWLLGLEMSREIAAIAVIIAVTLVAAKTLKEKILAFLWVFSIWDFFYYASLYVLIGWPPSALAEDVLFLIPFVWLAQVWFPLFVSGSTMILILYFLLKARN